MIENIANKFKSAQSDEELAEMQKQIEDVIGAEAFAEFLERRRKARIRNIAIAVGASVAVVGTAIWIASKTTSSDDENADETETETTEED